LKQEILLAFQIMVERNSVESVKWADGDSTRIKQHELKIFATDMAVGGSFVCCADRSGGGYLHADSACGCGDFPAGGNRSPGGSCSKRDACFACAAETRRNRAGQCAPRPCLLVWRSLQWPPYGQWGAVRHVRDDRLPSNAALRLDGPGGQSSKQTIGCCAHYRPGLSERRSNHRFILCRRRETGDDQGGACRSQGGGAFTGRATTEEMSH